MAGILARSVDVMTIRAGELVERFHADSAQQVVEDRTDLLLARLELVGDRTAGVSLGQERQRAVFSPGKLPFIRQPLAGSERGLGVRRDVHPTCLHHTNGRANELERIAPVKIAPRASAQELAGTGGRAGVKDDAGVGCLLLDQVKQHEGRMFHTFRARDQAIDLLLPEPIKGGGEGGHGINQLEIPLPVDIAGHTGTHALVRIDDYDANTLAHRKPVSSRRHVRHGTYGNGPRPGPA